MRIQGLPRLAAVVDHFGFSATNDFFFIKLYYMEWDAVKYVDNQIFGVPENAIDSVGCSGPGGPYVGFGIAGVVLFFFLWGAFWADLYEYVSTKCSAIGYAFYMVLVMTLLRSTIMENFSLVLWKPIIA